MSYPKQLLTEVPVSTVRSGGIDAARGFFALWVLFAHLIPMATYSQGEGAVPSLLVWISGALERLFQPVNELNPAVVGFIVLSGYCIHRTGFRSATSDVGRYAVKRLFRIFPTYLLASVFGLVGFATAIAINSDLGKALSGTTAIEPICIAAKLFALSAFVPNFHTCAFIGNAPLATVMVEIVLYAFYAAAFTFLVWQGKTAYIAVICTAAWVGGLIVAIVKPQYPGLYGWWQNGSLWGFLPYWWVGALFVSPIVSEKARRFLPLIVMSWLALTAALMMDVSQPALFAEFRKLVFAVLIGIIVVALDQIHLSPRNPLSSVGRAGYSLYAFHAPLTYVLCITGLPWWLIATANLVVASIMYVAVEEPFTRLGRQWPQLAAKGG